MSVVIIIKFNLLLLAAWPLHQLLFAPDPAHHALAGNALFLFLLKTCHVTLHQAAVLETNHPVAKQDISSEQGPLCLCIGRHRLQIDSHV